MIKHNDKIKENIPMCLIILKLFKPEYLKISSSFESISFMKKTCVDIKKMNGSISKIIDGAFKNDKKIKYEKVKFASLKKSNCSNRVIIIVIKKNIRKIFKKELKKSFNKNLIYVGIIFHK